jgi:hypothetical protein
LLTPHSTLLAIRAGYRPARRFGQYASVGDHCWPLALLG